MNKCCRNCKYLYLNWRSTPQKFCSLISNIEDNDPIFNEHYYPLSITNNKIKKPDQKSIVGISFIQLPEENIEKYEGYKGTVFKQYTQKELKERNIPITSIPLFTIKDSDTFYCALYEEDSMSYEERITKSRVNTIMGLSINIEEMEK